MGKKGFTLVELAIVLVIIGLLIGGILAAQSLTSTAKITQQIKQIQQIQIGITNFNTKYGCLPGDCKTLATNGDADGRVQGSTESTTPQQYDQWNNSEWLRVFNHLAITGMYDFKPYNDTALVSADAGIGYPRMVIQDNTTGSNGVPGGIVFGYEAANAYIQAGHKIRLAACDSTSATGPHTGGDNQIGFQCGLNAVDALAIDSKLDDGKPYSGDVVITSPYYIYLVPGNTLGNYDQTGTCADAGNKYLGSKTANCSLEIFVDNQIR